MLSLLIRRERTFEISQNPITITSLRNEGFAEIGRKRHGVIGCRLDCVGRVCFQIDPIEVKKTTQDRESRPGQGKLWIELDRLGITARGSLVTVVAIAAVLDRKATQVGIVGGGILCRFGGDGFLFGAGKFEAELFGDGAGDFALHGKDVVELAVITFGPDVLVGGGADHLHIHVHGVGDFLHAAFDDIGDAELLTDFAQVVRRAFVLLGRGAGDDFEIGDLRKAGENFVLNPFGEVTVGFLVAEIFERQNGDRFVTAPLGSIAPAGSRDCGRPPPFTFSNAEGARGGRALPIDTQGGRPR